MVSTINNNAINYDLYLCKYYIDLNYRTGEFIIGSKEDVLLTQKDGSNYVYSIELDKTLRFSMNDFVTLWTMQIFNSSSSSYKVTYKWNKLNKDKGVILQIAEVK